MPTSAEPPRFSAMSDRESATLSGEVEPESATAGGLLDELEDQAESDCARDAPDLALGLLSGSLTTLARVRFHPRCASGSTSCSDRTFKPRPCRRPSPASTHPRFPPPRWPLGCLHLLERCPSWLDLSPLTFELAEEIRLREGSPHPDPARDPASTASSFERRLFGRLELYRRMLLWMAWFWKSRDLMTSQPWHSPARPSFRTSNMPFRPILSPSSSQREASWQLSISQKQNRPTDIATDRPDESRSFRKTRSGRNACNRTGLRAPSRTDRTRTELATGLVRRFTGPKRPRAEGARLRGGTSSAPH